MNAPVVAGYTAGAWGSHCAGSSSITLGAGDNKTCVITFDDNPPPAPTCADTIMMLDRTGSMSSSDLASKRTAANALLDLYDNLAPPPKAAVGVFGGVSFGEPYNAQIVQGLTSTYSNLFNAITTGLASSGGYTNLASAINTAQNEFQTNGTPGREKVLILLSDGGTNRPTGSTPFDTGFKLPTSDIQNVAGDMWSTPAGAYGGGEASDNSGHRHQYSNFGFSIPAGVTINGIETHIGGWSTPVSSVNIWSDSFGLGGTIGDIPLWEEEGVETDLTTVAQTPALPPTTSDDSASPNGERFAKIATTEWICRAVNATGVQSLTLKYYWRGDTQGDGNEFGVVEYFTGGNCDSPTGLTTLASHDLDFGNLNASSWSALQNINIPATLNNTQFFIRFRSASNASDEHFRVDDVTVSGTPSALCQVGTDLSWDGGTTWSNEKSVSFDTSNTVYTVGNGTDSWGSHSWQVDDFNNTNFRLRIRDINPGSTCNVDLLETKVHYSTTANAVNDAYTAADNAKLAGTKIFTIHFGDPGSGNSDQNFLARLASGGTPNSPHQNGSFNDPGGTVTGDTGYLAPTLQSADSGGDGNGFEVNPGNAFIDDDSSANNIDGAGDRHQFSGYNIASLPPNAIVTGIEVRPNWWLDSTSNTNSLSVELSWNSGTTWTAVKNDTGESTSHSNTGTFGGQNDPWGRAWIQSDFNTDNFRVRVTSNSTSLTRDFYLDYVPVRIYYSVINENSDNDHFFISPTASDMQGIFNYIGAQVCPAAANPPVVTTPTTATLVVQTHVVNDNTGTKNPGDFTMSVTGVNPSLTSFSGLDTPGVIVTVEPGAFTVDQQGSSLGYSKSIGANCSGTIASGEIKVCTITLDDLPPPPPPPPPPNIDIGSWEEDPTTTP